MDRVSGGMNTVSPPFPPASLFRFESRLLRCAQNDTGRSDGRSMRRPYLGFGIRAGTGACPYEDSVAGMGEGVLPYAPTFRAHTQVRPYGNWATTGGVAPTSDEEPLTLPSPSRGEGSPRRAQHAAPLREMFAGMGEGVPPYAPTSAGYVPPFICASTKSSYSNSTPQTVQAIGSPGGGGRTSSFCSTPRQTW